MKIPKLKLKHKLALFNALSKALIVTLLLFIVPWVVNTITIKDTDDILIILPYSCLRMCGNTS